jgi:2-(1,2-epoxy-1,2-dihydrophenyl)acetyl-CoA isomerase
MSGPDVREFDDGHRQILGGATQMITTDAAADDLPAGEDPILVSDRGGVRTVTLNRPAAYNSFNIELKRALLAALATAAAEQSVRAVVITGAGRAFCAGQDLKEHLALVTAGDERLAATVSEFYNPLVLAIIGMAKPVIAAVNGPAAGAGAGLAFACDLRIAARSASFSMAFAGVALSADTGASYLLPRLIGHGRASRMMLLGDKVDAAEGRQIGMVDILVDDVELPRAAAELAESLAAGPALALSKIKESLLYAASADLPAALAFEDRAQAACFASPDHLEAIQAFVSKRPPRYAGTS